LGKTLKSVLNTFWRDRVGDHRIIVKREDEHILILVVHVAHRRNAGMLE